MSTIFRTVVTPQKAPFAISHKDEIMSIGSCFSENIGQKFREYKFRININPFGQQYNPHSIANAINRLLHPVPYTESDLIEHNELYHSYQHHGSYSRSTPAQTLQVINTELATAAQQLQQATVLLLTFGTSHIFSLKSGGQIVSNCHKQSGSIFERRLMEPGEIIAVLDEALGKVLANNPGIKIILTVSPVRYFAFGHYENSVSKAHLFSAIYALQKKHPSFYYFPAYELVMDDLRDYRFFAEDMLHPNHQATDYVWQSLCHTAIDKKTLEIMKEIDTILLAAKHRPRNPASKAHKDFAKMNLDKIGLLKKLYNLAFDEEEQKLASFL